MQMEKLISGRPARKWTRREYERMLEVGILGPDDRVELIAGDILVMSRENPPHSTAQSLGIIALQAAFGGGFHVRAGNPLAASADSLPEPDLAVLTGTPRDWAGDRHPTNASLIVEVSHTSLEFDLGPKALLYAQAGIADYWVVDIENAKLHVHRNPTRQGYRSVTTHKAPDMVKPLAAKRRIAVDDLLP